MKVNRIIVLLVCCFLLTSCIGKKLVCEQGELVDGVCKEVLLNDALIQCPTNYEFDEERGKCVSTMTIAAKTVNTCSKGYVIGNENWCISEKKYDMIEKRTCEPKNIQEGDTLSSVYVAPSNLCMEKICIEKNAAGTECLTYEEKSIPYTIKKECPEEGMSKWEGYCRKLSWLKIDTSCEGGTLDGDKCIIENLTDASISCEDEYKLIDGYKCQKVVYTEATKK